MWSNKNVVLVLATLALCLVALAPKPTRALSCPCYEHDNWNCTVPVDCEFGVVKDRCGCCDACGRGPGEMCGLYMPRCGSALFCDLQGEMYGNCTWKTPGGVE